MAQKAAHHFSKLTLLAGSIALLGACGGGGSSSAPAPSNQGSASFAVTDAPVDDVRQVQVTFYRISIKPSDGEPIEFDLDTPVTIENLLNLTGGESETVLPQTTVPAGDYEWVRLYITGGFPDSFVEENNGSQLDLFIPGQQNGNGNSERWLHLNSGFTIAAGGRSDFTIDFVLRKALTKPANQSHYLLRPSLRLLNNIEVGTITGTVDDALINDPTCSNDPVNETGSSVYLYTGDVMPEDIFETDTQASDEFSAQRPLTTTEVKQNMDTGAWEYTIGFVAEGDYTVAFTCQSSDDALSSDDDIIFVQPTAVSVQSGAESSVDFTAVEPPAETPSPEQSAP